MSTIVRISIFFVCILSFVAVTLLGVMVISTVGHTAECLSSAREVRAVHGIKAWSGKSAHVAGHEGTTCYYVSRRPGESAALKQASIAAKREHDIEIKKLLPTSMPPATTSVAVAHDHQAHDEAQSFIDRWVPPAQNDDIISRVHRMVLKRAIVETILARMN